MKLLTSVWFWLGAVGVSVVTYGVFDALNTQEEVQVEVNEATKETDSSTSAVELNSSAEKDV